jgi:hypothetical protein
MRCPPPPLSPPVCIYVLKNKQLQSFISIFNRAGPPFIRFFIALKFIKNYQIEQKMNIIIIDHSLKLDKSIN